jgi:hypothetical protein
VDTSKFGDYFDHLWVFSYHEGIRSRRRSCYISLERIWHDLSNGISHAPKFQRKPKILVGEKRSEPSEVNFHSFISAASGEMKIEFFYAWDNLHSAR